MRIQPYPVFPGSTLTVQGTPKALIKDPVSGALWLLVQVPGPLTPVHVTPVGMELPDGSRFCGAAMSDGTLFVATAGLPPPPTGPAMEITEAPE